MQDSGTFVSPISVRRIAEIPSGFTILGWPDLNGDGTDDLVTQEDATGATIGYLFTNGAISASGQLPGLPATGGFRTIGFPDLDGQNGSDLVIQASSGYTFAYILNGTGVTSSSQIPGAPAPGPWSTIGFPDLNGDGKADVAIQEQGGFTFAALMDGLTELERGPIPGLPQDDPTNYATIGFPDLDAQNGNDIVMQHSGGFTFAVLMNGLTDLSRAPIPGLPTDDPTNYQTVGFPQLDGANGADLVIRHSGGFTFGVLMDGTTAGASGILPGQAGGEDSVLGWENAWNVIPEPTP